MPPCSIIPSTLTISSYNSIKLPIFQFERYNLLENYECSDIVGIQISIEPELTLNLSFFSCNLVRFMILKTFLYKLIKKNPQRKYFQVPPRSAISDTYLTTFITNIIRFNEFCYKVPDGQADGFMKTHKTNAEHLLF